MSLKFRNSHTTSHTISNTNSSINSRRGFGIIQNNNIQNGKRTKRYNSQLNLPLDEVYYYKDSCKVYYGEPLKPPPLFIAIQYRKLSSFQVRPLILNTNGKYQWGFIGNLSMKELLIIVRALLASKKFNKSQRK